MVRKLIVDFTILAVSFFGTWYLLSQIQFVKEEKKLEISLKQEEKIGRVFKNIFIADAEIVDDDMVRLSLKIITN